MKGKEQRRKDKSREEKKRKKRKDHPYSGSSYLSTQSPSGSSLSLPHPHPSSPSLSPARCSSHPRVATPVLWMKSCSIITPLGVNRKECSAAPLVISACRLSSWYSLQPRSKCLTFWTLSEHWHCVESYDGRRIKKDLKYPRPSRNWWIVEATVWSVPVMSSVGFQQGLQSLCLRAVSQYSRPLALVVHVCYHSLRLTSWICRLM